MNSKPIFQVENFGVSFSQYVKGIERRELHVITNLDINLYKGKILAVLGSSGSGKSLLAHAILGILPYNASIYGKMYFKGQEISQKDREALRGHAISLIPQSVNYLDPLIKVGKQVGFSLRQKSEAEKKQLVLQQFAKYGLAPEVYDYYPHQLSGGMARRVLLSTALLAESEIIIADEPTPGLDEQSLKEVLADFRKTTDEGCAVLMITHDINAARTIADQIAVFYAGSTLEIANVEEMTGDGSKLRHPYTKALLRAMPDTEFVPVEGTQPMPGEMTKGCLFSDRCAYKTEQCLAETPPLRDVRGGKVRCFHAS
ncbi:MAG: ABC transporter ATP-binding protein [Lachnospiraceae bacterium]|nr:ABC transporter ATP-binding protein [Lachnospiraceae bacterium]